MLAVATAHATFQEVNEKREELRRAEEAHAEAMAHVLKGQEEAEKKDPRLRAKRLREEKERKKRARELEAEAVKKARIRRRYNRSVQCACVCSS